MPEEPRITAEAVEHAEDTETIFARFWADGRIADDEVRILRDRLRAQTSLNAAIDEAVALMVAVGRRGPDAPRFRRLMREHDRRLRVVVRNDDRGGPTAA